MRRSGAWRWLPDDGLAMVVGSGTPELAGDLYVVDLSDGSVRSLTSGLAVAPDLTVSPDGEWLAFTATVDGRTDIYVASRDGRLGARHHERRRHGATWGPTTVVGGPSAWTRDGRPDYRS